MKKFKRMLCAVLVLTAVTSSVAFAGTRYITSSVHFRTAASNKSKIIRVLEEGEKVKTLGPKKKVKTKNATSTWLKCKYNGKTGWICAKYLTSQKPVVEED